ncbi:MAG TPA: tRNA pseudouridine(38-40) synthase TruA [Halanaerobiales bacterium]|nr:tRNA pseudouridine(38-40) synthase TruA [Halanaerobiales bacterium]
MRFYKVILEYDGTNYNGWQRQKNTDTTIQQIVEEKLSIINKSFVLATSAGRTDAGVHAKRQVVNFKLDVDVPVRRIPFALNSLLPKDIICTDSEEVDEDFHARHDAKGKLYRYRLSNSRFPSVFTRNYVYNIRSKIDFKKIKKAAPLLVGTHDFASFQNSGSDMEDTVRTIEKIDIYQVEDEYHFDIKGSGFLYNMVRIIMGTFIEIGQDKIKLDDLEDIMESKNRRRAGFTAPAKGLTLMDVYY